MKSCLECGKKLTGKQRQFCTARCCLIHWRAVQKELARTDWHSPVEAVEAARTAMGGIDLDPASCEAANRIVRATKFYSIRDNGLIQPWSGKLWLNPPYSRYAPKFVQRFIEFFASGNIEQAVLLLATHHLCTDWIKPLLALHPLQCLPSRRLRFSGSVKHPAHSSVILGLGMEEQAFRQAFSGIGHVSRL
jgi:ParB family transcriptional regulator, chromosome partitioning protein